MMQFHKLGSGWYRTNYFAPSGACYEVIRRGRRWIASVRYPGEITFTALPGVPLTRTMRAAVAQCDDHRRGAL